LLRLMLRTLVRVQEIAPPWVHTGLAGDINGHAVPLDRFIEDAIGVLATDAEEVLIDEAKIFRNDAGPNEYVYFN